MLPDFFIVGAAKSGTTSLYHYLDEHPQVYMSPIKEPNHFCTDIKPENFSKEFIQHEKEKNLNLKKYLAGPMTEKHWGYFVTEKQDYELLFKNSEPEKVKGEVSNSYLFSKEAAQNIRKQIPAAKIIMMLRSPAERAYSHYLANLRDGKTFLSFRDELEKDQQKFPKGWGQSYLYLEMGFYYDQVKKYMDVFPASQIKIYLYDDFKKDPSTIMNDLFDFLGITQKAYAGFQIHNEARKPLNSRLLYILSQTGIKKKIFHTIPPSLRKQVKNLFFHHKKAEPIKESDRNYLNGIYLDDISKLEKLLNRDLSSWRK
jgi:hypothetical protein